MKIDRAEVERVIDDLETKVKKAQLYAEEYRETKAWTMVNLFESNSLAYEYCIARLRELL